MSHATVKTMTGRVAESLSVEEWGELDEEIRGELVDGRIVEGEMPNSPHESVVTWLILLLAPYFQSKGGFVFGSNTKIAISARRGRIPDVVCFAPGKRPDRQGVIKVTPDVVVEVISSQPVHIRRDRIEKPDEYAKIGVQSYWLVDPEARTFEIFDLDASRRYVRACAAAEGKIENVPGCPGLVVDVDALWAEVDRLSADA